MGVFIFRLLGLGFGLHGKPVALRCAALAREYQYQAIGDMEFKRDINHHRHYHYLCLRDPANAIGMAMAMAMALRVSALHC